MRTSRRYGGRVCRHAHVVECALYAFRPTIAPHFAAAQAGRTMGLAAVARFVQGAWREVDRVVVEGAGGFLVPLTASDSFTDLACALNLPVVRVVGLRLGAINHALFDLRGDHRPWPGIGRLGRHHAGTKAGGWNARGSAGSSAGAMFRYSPLSCAGRSRVRATLSPFHRCRVPRGGTPPGVPRAPCPCPLPPCCR